MFVRTCRGGRKFALFFCFFVDGSWCFTNVGWAKARQRRVHHVQSDGSEFGGHVAGAPTPILRCVRSDEIYLPIRLPHNRRAGKGARATCPPNSEPSLRTGGHVAGAPLPTLRYV